jgi:hypothetical protein
MTLAAGNGIGPWQKKTAAMDVRTHRGRLPTVSCPQVRILVVVEKENGVVPVRTGGGTLREWQTSRR